MKNYYLTLLKIGGTLSEGLLPQLCHAVYLDGFSHLRWAGPMRECESPSWCRRLQAKILERNVSGPVQFMARLPNGDPWRTMKFCQEMSLSFHLSIDVDDDGFTGDPQQEWWEPGMRAMAGHRRILHTVGQDRTMLPLEMITTIPPESPLFQRPKLMDFNVAQLGHQNLDTPRYYDYAQKA